jgi:hypothetical protein
MDHEEAARMQASSRYLMGDLSEEERAAFEEHFFDCSPCAKDVATGAMFAQDVRTVFAERPAEKPAGWLERWRGKFRLDFAMPVATAAACAGLGLMVFQNVGLRNELAMVNQPQQPVSVTLKLARGAESVHVSKTAPFWEVHFRLVDPTEASSYQCSIERGGQLLKTVTLKPPANGQQFAILLRTSEFPAGSYVFKVRAGNSTTILSTYSTDLIFD